MQIQCHKCRNPLMLSAPGVHFQCPICGAINSVAIPLSSTSQPAPARDRRPAVIAVAFVGLGFVGLVLAWGGVVVGLLLLGWAVAGALGKVPGPLQWTYPGAPARGRLAAIGIGLGAFVTTCGVMGGVARLEKAEKAEREAREASEREAAAEVERARQEAAEAAARAAREAALKANAAAAASECGGRLDAVEALIAEGRWSEADASMEAASAAIAEHRAMTPIPAEIAALVPRVDALAAKLDAARRDREIAAWIARAEAVVDDKDRCEDEAEVAAARAPIVGLAESDPRQAQVQALRARLDGCLEAMPPPSEWIYSVRSDPMGGTVATARVESANAFDFGFPYQGAQHARLTLRSDKGLNVLLAIERGQFMCTMGCSVLVRFDDDTAQRWRATGPSDHDSTVIFLRSESKFLKQLKKAQVLRIEAEFFQEGTRVLEFPVARLDAEQLR
ncbi:MAG: hypothetical protein R3B09_32405 [Nannocystaceae bacterium]